MVYSIHILHTTDKLYYENRYIRRSDRCVMYHFVANIDYRYLWIGPIAHEETVECGYFINKFYNIKMVRN